MGEGMAIGNPLNNCVSRIKNTCIVFIYIEGKFCLLVKVESGCTFALHSKSNEVNFPRRTIFQRHIHLLKQPNYAIYHQRTGTRI